MTCRELEYDGTGGTSLVVFGVWGGFGSATQRAAELTDFTDAEGLRDPPCTPKDGLWL